MLPEDNIDQLFRSALENANEIPPPNAWQGISNQLSNVSSASQTVAAKSWFAKLGLVSKVAILSTVIVGGIVAFELSKDDSLMSNRNNALSTQNEISQNDILPEEKDNGVIASIKTNGSVPSANNSNKIQLQSQNEPAKNLTFDPPISAIKKDHLSGVHSEVNDENLLNRIQSNITDRIEVPKFKNETSSVLGNIVENGCKNKIELNVVESDSNGRLIQVNCNGNVKNSYLNYGDEHQLFFEGNRLAINHFYKVNSRKDFYLKVVIISFLDL